MNVTVLVNPAARGGAARDAASRAVETLRAHGLRTALLSGGSAAESNGLLRGAVERGTDAVVVAGGDGTAHLAIQVLAGTGVPLGILPAGTGNDLATSLGLGGRDVDTAVAAILAGTTREIDLARVTRTDASTAHFATVMASGFDSKVNDRANAMRRPRGSARYTLAILREFVTLAGIPYVVDMTLADGTVLRRDGDLVMATVGNGATYGGGIPICPDAELDDGLLDVTLVRPAGRLRLLGLLPRVYRGTHTTVAEVSTHRVRSVRLEAPSVTGYADGDPIGSLPLTIDVAPRALRVYTVR